LEECLHTLKNGKKCRAIALRNQPWCYFHEPFYCKRPAVRKRTPLPPRPAATQHSSHARVPSVQSALSRILQALAVDSIDSKRAGLVLYRLQITLDNSEPA
jgi:hypothetical protein